MNKMSIRKDDLVVVLSGKDKGKQGKVLEVMPKSGKVVVEKINVVSRHTKPRNCLLYTSPSPRDRSLSRMPSSA